MKKYIVTLTMKEHESPGRSATKGKHSAQQVLNAPVPLGCDGVNYLIKQAG